MIILKNKKNNYKKIELKKIYFFNKNIFVYK
jgi:hypothetical protein